MKTYNKKRQGKAIIKMIKDTFHQYKYYQVFLFDHDPSNDPEGEPIRTFYQQDKQETSKAVFEILEDDQVYIKNKPLHGGLLEYINYNEFCLKPLDDKYTITYDEYTNHDTFYNLAWYEFKDKNTGYTIQLQFMNY